VYVHTVKFRIVQRLQKIYEVHLKCYKMLNLYKKKKINEASFPTTPVGMQEDRTSDCNVNRFWQNKLCHKLTQFQTW